MSTDRGAARPFFPRIDLLMAVLGPAVVLVAAGYQRRWMSDDGFINMRVVQNLLSGNGPVLNAGERIEVATSPLWVYLVGAVQFVTRLRLEHVFVVVGLVCTGSGVVAAGAGSAVIGRSPARPASRTLHADVPERFAGVQGSAGAGAGMGVRRRRVLWLPAGAVVYAALTPAWDFASSGLDGSLAVAWIGLSVLLLALAERGRGSRWGLAAALVIGLAPLVRPDLTVMGAVLFLALLGLERRLGPRRVLLLLAVGGAVPVLYQVFRMGYYGLAVPNTAVAKEATWWRSEQGFAYLDDLMSNFGLGLPLVMAGLLAVLVGGAAWADGARSRLVPLAAPVVAGLLHGAYVVGVGGDFMSARLLLPSVFAVVAPVAVVGVPLPRLRPAEWRAAVVVPLAVIAGWAYLCQTQYGLPYPRFGPKGINDERGFYTDLTQEKRPVVLDTYRITRLWRIGKLAHVLVDERREVVCMMPDAACAEPAPPLAARWGSRAKAVVAHGNIGVPSAGAPLEVHIADHGGLGDPLAARMKLERRGRPGHEKLLPLEWIVARFAEPGAPLPPGFDQAKVDAARRVLECPQWQEIDRAVTGRLTAGRFVKNLFGALGRSRLRIDVQRPPVDCRFGE